MTADILRSCVDITHSRDSLWQARCLKCGRFIGASPYLRVVGMLELQHKCEGMEAFRPLPQWTSRLSKN
jgi:hypothetical protein